jgi:transcriptional regulator with XRE-family HTH domain
MHYLTSALHNLKTKFYIKERRKEVASLLSRSTSEREIAEKLGVDRSTISRDIKALKIECQQFIFDLAKSDLAYYFKQSLDGIIEAKKESWKIFIDPYVPVREKLLALKIIIQSDETRFKLLTEGPSVLNMKSMEDRLQKIEHDDQEKQRY